jgi:hypothetical protein
MRLEEIEQTRIGTLFGVPAHLYRQAANDLLRLGASPGDQRPRACFHHELRLRFFSGFFRTRSRGFGQKPNTSLRPSGGGFLSRFGGADR